MTEAPFARFLAAEPAEARACWYALDAIARECGTDIAKLPRRVALSALPGAAHGRAKALYGRLAALGSIERCCGPGLIDLEDVGNGAETTAVIVIAPTDEKEQR